jgi:hypothetical protein
MRPQAAEKAGAAGAVDLGQIVTSALYPRPLCRVLPSRPSEFRYAEPEASGLLDSLHCPLRFSNGWNSYRDQWTDRRFR